MQTTTENPKTETEKIERNLGEEWEDWNGSLDRTAVTSEAPKRFFVFFNLVYSLLLSFVIFLFVFLIIPRVTQFFALGDIVLYSFATLASIGFLLTTPLQVIYTKFFRNKYLMNYLRFYYIYFLEPLFWFADKTGISKDRLANSYVKIHNQLAEADIIIKKNKRSKILVLLPRCLTKECLSKIKELSEKYQFVMVTVSGGTLARKKIREIRPSSVIGIACERDLLSGIKDTQKKLDVIGIPNQRPGGPCKDTVVDLDYFEEILSKIT